LRVKAKTPAFAHHHHTTSFTMPVGQFTGDTLMSGYALGRNSSRVLNPPGGKTSDIFGTASTSSSSSYSQDPAPSRRPNPVQQARNESTVFRSPVTRKTEDAAAAAASRRNRSTVFAPSSPCGQVPWATEDDKAPNAIASRPNTDPSPPPIMAAPAPPPATKTAPPAISNEPVPPSIDQAQAINPGVRGSSTGDVLMSGHSGRNSSRVLQPPGGASSFSFF
jgi:hypothetical protein